MIAGRLRTGLGVAGSLAVALVLSAGCNTAGGGGGGGELTEEQLHATDTLRLICVPVDDSVIEELLADIAEDYEAGMTSAEAVAEGVITCAGLFEGPPSGCPTNCSKCYAACIDQIY